MQNKIWQVGYFSRRWNSIQKTQGYGMTWALDFGLRVSSLPSGWCSRYSTPQYYGLSQSKSHAAKNTIGFMHINILSGKTRKTIMGLWHLRLWGTTNIKWSQGCLVRLELWLDYFVYPKAPCESYLDQTSSSLKEATFGDSKVTIKAQDRRFVDIATHDSPLLIKGTLEQHQYSQDNSRMAEHFLDFWAPMWLRDTVEEALNDSWHEVCQEVTRDLEPVPPIHVSWSDPVLVQQTIARMKSYKAPGIDGWRAQELKLLPYLAIQHLARIFDRIWDSQMTHNHKCSRGQSF